MEIYWCEKLKVGNKEKFQDFCTGMSQRIAQGHARYGLPSAADRYMWKMGEELRAYKKTGNMEALLNIANYAYLESLCPENPKFHYDPTAKSNTRK